MVEAVRNAGVQVVSDDTTLNEKAFLEATSRQLESQNLMLNFGAVKNKLTKPNPNPRPHISSPLESMSEHALRRYESLHGPLAPKFARAQEKSPFAFAVAESMQKNPYWGDLNTAKVPQNTHVPQRNTAEVVPSGMAVAPEVAPGLIDWMRNTGQTRAYIPRSSTHGLHIELVPSRTEASQSSSPDRSSFVHRIGARAKNIFSRSSLASGSEKSDRKPSHAASLHTSRIAGRPTEREHLQYALRGSDTVQLENSIYNQVGWGKISASNSPTDHQPITPESLGQTGQNWLDAGLQRRRGSKYK